MFYIQKVIGASVLPPASLIILIVIGLLIIRRWPRTGYATVWIGVVSLLLLSLPITSDLLVRTVGDVAPFSAERAKNAQAIVILGGGRRYAPEYGGETISRFALQRLRYGAKLARELDLPVLVTGGAVYGSGKSEGELMADALEESFSTPVEWIESQSRNTHENATLSAPMLRDAGIQTVILVTHDIHQRRSLAEFRAVGIDAIPASVTTRARPEARSFPEHMPNSGSLHMSALALHELLGYFVLTRRLDPEVRAHQS
jgi:uncharacterized SAM-binding protein YcdF (DUF218 family)